MTLKLRPYQEKAIEDLFAYWDSGKGVAPLVILPTGAGKSLLIASFCERVLKESPYVRIMVCVHSRELVQQNHDELKACWPEADTGIYSAGLNSRDLKNRIIFAGIQSVYNKIFKFPKIDIVIIDEAHAIPRSADTRYGKFIADLKLANPHVCIFGTTATPFRTETGLLTEGDGRLFDGVAHVTEIKTLIDQGYLVPIISKGGVQKIDLKGVHIRAGDYAANELARAADDPMLVKLAVDEFVEYGKDRKSWLVYCSGVDHAHHVCKEIKSHGINCKVLTGDTPLKERDEILNEFKSGKLRCICNVMVLTTGFNCPGTDMICLLFSTISPGKYIQVVGRGTRNAPGKTDCLVMDYGNNIVTHGVLDAIDIVKKNDVFNCKPSPPPMKECPACKCIFHARIMKCPGCGYDFPLPDASVKHGVEAYDGAVLADQQKPFMVDVTDTWVSRHKKSGKPDSVKVAFYDKMEKEWPMWLSLDSTSQYAQEKSQAIVKQLGGKAVDVDSALDEHFNWKQVDKIQVRMDGRFPRILGFVFKPNQTQQQKLGEEE